MRIEGRGIAVGLLVAVTTLILIGVATRGLYSHHYHQDSEESVSIVATVTDDKSASTAAPVSPGPAEGVDLAEGSSRKGGPEEQTVETTVEPLTSGEPGSRASKLTMIDLHGGNEDSNASVSNDGDVEVEGDEDEDEDDDDDEDEDEDEKGGDEDGEKEEKEAVRKSRKHRKHAKKHAKRPKNGNATTRSKKNNGAQGETGPQVIQVGRLQEVVRIPKHKQQTFWGWLSSLITGHHGDSRQQVFSATASSRRSRRSSSQ